MFFEIFNVVIKKKKKYFQVYDPVRDTFLSEINCANESR